MNLGQYISNTPVERLQERIERTYASEPRNDHVATYGTLDERPSDRGLDEHLAALRLGDLARHLIDTRDTWLARSRGEATQRSDSEEVKGFCREAAKALGPVIAKVVNAQRWHELKAKIEREAA